METQPVTLSLKMQITRDRGGKIVNLAVAGFPADWSTNRVVEDCRGAVDAGTANDIDRAIVEAVSAGHWQFANSTGGPEWRLFVDDN